jgi:hypothetical protein
MNTMPNDNPPLNSGEDWPYGYGKCCCGCGKKARVVNGVLHKFYRGYQLSLPPQLHLPDEAQTDRQVN